MLNWEQIGTFQNKKDFDDYVFAKQLKLRVEKSYKSKCKHSTECLRKTQYLSCICNDRFCFDRYHKDSCELHGIKLKKLYILKTNQNINLKAKILIKMIFIFTLFLFSIICLF